MRDWGNFMAKYVVFESNLYGTYAVIFPSHIEHGYARNFPGTMTSAGFVQIRPEGITAHGESESLKLKWQEGDTWLLQRLLGQAPD